MSAAAQTTQITDNVNQGYIAGRDLYLDGGTTTRTHAETIESVHNIQAGNVTINNYGPEAKAKEARALRIGKFFQADVINFYGRDGQGTDDEEDDGEPENPQPKETEAFKDPVVPLPPRPYALRNLRLEVAKDVEQGFEEQRLIVVSSFRQELSIAAAYSLIESRRLSSYKKKALVLNVLPDSSQLSVDLFTRPEYHQRRQEVVLVDVNRAGLFLDSIRNLSMLQAELIQDSLRNRDAFVICSLSDQLLYQEDCDALFRWRVDFLPAVLHRDFSVDEAQELWRSLEEQWTSRLWGFTREDYYQQVWGYLQKGAVALLNEVERRRELTKLSLSESLDKIQLVKARDVFRADSAVHAAAVYTGVYFPGLTPLDFDLMVRKILDEDTTTIEEEVEAVSEKGEVHKHRKKVQRRWVELWQEGSDRILAECRLEAVLQGDGTHAMEFTEPYLRKELRGYLEKSHPIFVLQTFGRLRQLGLLFASDVSGAIVERLIRLSVERTLSDPAYCSEEWLLRLVETVEHLLAAPGDPLSGARTRLSVRRHFYDRLSQLIREMLQTPLRDVVHRFLERLLEADADFAQDLLFGLLDRLRFEPQFQALAWIRRFLDRLAAMGNGEVRTTVYNRLVAFTLGSGSRVYSVLEEIAGWLPEPGLDARRYAPSSEDALRLLADYCFYSLRNFPGDSRGEWPSQYDLFVSLSLDPATTAERVGWFAVWLAHPGMKQVLAGNPAFDDALRSDPEQLFLTVIAYFVEEWLLILEGNDSKKPPKEASALADLLLLAIAARLEERHRKKLVRGWQARQQKYVRDINRVPVGDRVKRNQLLTRRRKLSELQRRFQNLPTDRATRGRKQS